MTHARTFTDANFQTDVLSSDQLVVVDFWAPWCGPCRAVGPTIEELASEESDSANVGKLNVDENPQTAAALGINSIPAVVLFRNGEVVDTLVGVRSKADYQRAIHAAA